jgi:hypothetical protein
MALTSSAAQVSAEANVLATLSRSQNFKQALDTCKFFHRRRTISYSEVTFSAYIKRRPSFGGG